MRNRLVRSSQPRNAKNHRDVYFTVNREHLRRASLPLGALYNTLKGKHQAVAQGRFSKASGGAGDRTLNPPITRLPLKVMEELENGN